MEHKLMRVVLGTSISANPSTDLGPDGELVVHNGKLLGEFMFPSYPQAGDDIDIEIGGQPDRATVLRTVWPTIEKGEYFDGSGTFSEAPILMVR